MQHSRSTALVVAVALCAFAAAAASALASTRTLESNVLYGLKLGECANVYTGPRIDVFPPRMWANYDTTGRVGQKVAYQSRLYRLDAGTWTLVERRAWQFAYARNQAPRGFDPGNLVTYVVGTWIFTGAELGNDPFQFNETSYFIEQPGRYRVVADMYWYANAYSRTRRVTKWQPLRQELSGDSPAILDCDFTS